MPDLINFAVSHLGAASVMIPRIQFSGQVVDSQTQQTVLADFSGANVIVFPRDVPAILPTQADRQELADLIGMFLIRKKTGVF